MARCSVATRSSLASGVAAGPSLYATTAVRPQIREIGVFNTTAVAVAVGIVRATTAGTQGAGLTEVCDSDLSHVVIATAFNTHTVAPTVSAASRQTSLGAAIGSGVIWTWGPGEFILTNAVTDGVVINCPTGTGQILDFYIVWEE